jgi:hypothetical protein
MLIAIQKAIANIAAGLLVVWVMGSQGVINFGMIYLLLTISQID